MAHVSHEQAVYQDEARELVRICAKLMIVYEEISALCTAAVEPLTVQGQQEAAEAMAERALLAQKEAGTVEGWMTFWQQTLFSQ